jgi:8-amino-7-oxononanoate synthase
VRSGRTPLTGAQSRDLLGSAAVSFLDRVHAALADLEAQGLRRQARPIDGPQGPRIVVDGRTVLCLCSNNYLGLSGHPALIGAARRGLDEEGAGAGASRLISGSMRAHRDAERALAAFVGQPAAVLFSTGYAGNVGTLQALAGRDDVIFSDALNHASLIDGARLSRARIVIYAHGDADDLERKLRAERHTGQGALVVTESLFSMDGDVPDLARLAELARAHDAGFVVDEAHAVGVLGPEGKGLCAARGVTPDVLIGTLGKAFGAQGAFTSAQPATIDLIRNRARSYVFSTAPSPALARAAELAVRLVRDADGLRAALARHAARLRSGLAELGHRIVPGESAIIPVMVGAPDATMRLSHALLERGVFAHGIRPPTVPPGTGRLRVVPMATHTNEDIEEALAAFAAIKS